MGLDVGEELEESLEDGVVLCRYLEALDCFLILSVWHSLSHRPLVL